MPVIIPGSAIGRIINKVIDCLPKKSVLYIAAAAKVPNIIAAKVETNATWRDKETALQISSLDKTIENHLSV